jgi:hypothetical protein
MSLVILSLGVTLALLGCGAGNAKAPDAALEATDVTLDATDAGPEAGADSAEALDALIEPDVLRPPLTIVPARPPASPVGEPFAFAMQAEGGQTPYSGWAVTLGELPPGTTLDTTTGQWKGVPTSEGVFLFVVSVHDALGGEASQLIGLRIGDPAAEGPLAARARRYQQVYEARHLWHGMSYGNWRPDDPDGDYGLSTLGDATFVSGQCTQAMAFRAAEEKSPEALAVVTAQLEGWRFFQELTGVPGLVGRSFMREDDPIEDSARAELDAPGSDWHRGTGDHAGWIWRGDTSRDQVSGAVLGIATAFDAVDDVHVKQLAADFMADTVDHLWANDLQFVDPDGEPTTYGDLSGERLEHWPLPNGQAAVSLLAWVKAAWHMTGEARFDQRYRELLFDRERPCGTSRRPASTTRWRCTARCRWSSRSPRRPCATSGSRTARTPASKRTPSGPTRRSCPSRWRRACPTWSSGIAGPSPSTAATTAARSARAATTCSPTGWPGTSAS